MRQMTHEETSKIDFRTKVLNQYGPAYNATLRQCDNATICDFRGVLTSLFIFNKMRRDATGKNPI